MGLQSEMRLNREIKAVQSSTCRKRLSTKKYGKNYEETFFPIVSHTMIIAFLTAAAHHKLNINRTDIKTTFLHGDLEEEMYISQSVGYTIPN